MHVENDRYRVDEFLGSQAKWPIIVEGIAVLFLVHPFFVGLFGVENYLGHSIAEWNRFILLLPLGGVIGIFIIMLIMGRSDYRFKIAIHILMAALLTGFLVYIWVGVGMLDPTRSIFSSILRMLPSTLFILALGIAVFFAMLSELHPYIEEINYALTRTHVGDFSYKITNDKILDDKVFSPIANSLNKLMDTTTHLLRSLNATEVLLSTSTELSDTANGLSASSEEVTSTSQAMSNVANEQTERTQEIYEEITKLNSVISDITDRIRQNSEFVSQIALQTNILALNAGIEASRAGDYGRGFSVVADNVRRLSEQSKNAAESIIEVSDSIVENLQKAFNSISLNVEQLASLSEETSASAEEVASIAEEMSASVEELANSANELREMADRARNYIIDNNLEGLLDGLDNKSDD